MPEKGCCIWHGIENCNLQRYANLNTGPMIEHDPDSDQCTTGKLVMILHGTSFLHLPLIRHVTNACLNACTFDDCTMSSYRSQAAPEIALIRSYHDRRRILFELHQTTSYRRKFFPSDDAAGFHGQRHHFSSIQGNPDVQQLLPSHFLAYPEKDAF